MDGMVNRCELSINVVTKGKPKMLRGLGQKALERVPGLAITLSWTPKAVSQNNFSKSMLLVYDPLRECLVLRAAVMMHNFSVESDVP